MYFLKVINSLPEKLSKYNMFIFFSIQGAYEKNHLYKSKVHLFSSAFKVLTKKKRLYKSKVHLFSSVFKALTKKLMYQKYKYKYIVKS